MAIAKATTLLTTRDELSGPLKKGERSIQNFSKRASKTIKRIAVAFAAAGAAALVFARTSLRAFAEQEKAERQLAAAIEGTVRNTEMAVERAKAFAASLQRLTIHGDETTLQVMAMGRNLGIATEQLEVATVATIGLAAKFRIDLKTAMMLVGRASQGQTSMLKRYNIILDETLSPQEQFNELLKLGAQGFRLAEAEAQTLSGTYQQIVNILGDLKEEVGRGILIGFAGSSLDDVKDMKRELREMSDDALLLGEAFGKVAKALAEIVRTIQASAVTVQVIAENAGEFAKLLAKRTIEKGPIGAFEALSELNEDLSSKVVERMIEMEKAMARAREEAARLDDEAKAAAKALADIPTRTRVEIDTSVSTAELLAQQRARQRAQARGERLPVDVNVNVEAPDDRRMPEREGDARRRRADEPRRPLTADELADAVRQGLSVDQMERITVEQMRQFREMRERAIRGMDESAREFNRFRGLSVTERQSALESFRERERARMELERERAEFAREQSRRIGVEVAPQAVGEVSEEDVSRRLEEIRRREDARGAGRDMIDRGGAGRIEGLQETFRRIQMSAARVRDDGEPDERQTSKHTKDTAKHTKDTKDAAERTSETLLRIERRMARIEKGLPLVGAFG